MRTRIALIIATAIMLVAGGAAVLIKGATSDAGPSAVVRRANLHLRLVETGVLRPAESMTYRSPLVGREAEVLLLAPEGARVAPGDLLVRLDATELANELQRANQALRQADIDVRVADIARQQSELALETVTNGEGSLGVDEARSSVVLAEKRVRLLREDYDGLGPLLEKGYVTRDEFNRAGLELATAETALEQARRKADMLARQAYPADRRKAALALAERQAQLANARPRVDEMRRWAATLEQSIAACEVRARSAGLVTHEMNLITSPPRKVRVGDRVTSSQGLVTIPAIDRMIVAVSIREVDLHRVRVGQAALVKVEAFPDLEMRGHVMRIGTLASDNGPASTRNGSEKRFDMMVEIDVADARLRPEMTASVEVHIGERNGVLVMPMSAVFEQDGVAVASVLRRWGHQTRVLELGDSDGALIEVRAGVREGDRVSLVEMANAPASR